ncbi:type IV pilus biogenesis protein PilM [Gracilibacillus marinus]|uniref:Type IV pilus biogenesis protein PilM n=1 Tax=Gracilibacillus marinus TaxID=630535 RepID=A0ABV8VQ08_9BACI
MNFLKKDRINLVIHESTIRYLIHSGTTIVDYGELPLEQGIIDDGVIVKQDALQNQLLTLVQQKKWKNKHVAICVPDAFVTIREEKIPAQLNREETKQYILLEARDNIRLPIQNPLIDFADLEEGPEDGFRKVLLFAFPKDKLQSYVDVFEHVHLKVAIADVSFLSHYRVFHQLQLTKEHQHLLLIQWGMHHLVLTVFNKEIPIFNRHIHIGHQRQAMDSDALLQESIEDQLLTIDRFIDFYRYSIMNDTAQVTDVLLVGDHPKRQTLQQIIQERLNIPIHQLSLPNDLASYYSDVYGLTLRKKM